MMDNIQMDPWEERRSFQNLFLLNLLAEVEKKDELSLRSR